jgi:hypothetical protein
LSGYPTNQALAAGSDGDAAFKRELLVEVFTLPLADRTDDEIIQRAAAFQFREADLL